VATAKPAAYAGGERETSKAVDAVSNSGFSLHGDYVGAGGRLLSVRNARAAIGWTFRDRDQQA